MGYADNDGNLSHRDLECGRQYICWPGNLGKASCLCNTTFNTSLITFGYELNELCFSFMINNCSKKNVDVQYSYSAYFFLLHVSCGSDRSSAADPSLFEGHDQI